MPAVQTTYPTTHPKGTPGMWVNMENWNAITRICETVAGIAFGLAVTRGTGAKGAVLGGAVAGFLGVSLRDVTLINTPVDVYARYQNMGVATLGKIWVAPDAAVLAGGDVYYVSATGVFTAAAGAGIVGPVVGAKYESATGGAGELAVLSLGIQR